MVEKEGEEGLEKKKEKETEETQTSGQPASPHCLLPLCPVFVHKSDRGSAHSGSFPHYESHQLGLRPEEIVFVGSQVRTPSHIHSRARRGSGRCDKTGLKPKEKKAGRKQQRGFNEKTHLAETGEREDWLAPQKEE